MKTAVRDNSWFGYVPDLPDHRDRPLAITQHLFEGAVPPAAKLYAQSAFQFPVYDQGPIGSCVGNAVAAAIQYLYRRNKRPNVTPSRLAIYYGARRMEGTTMSDAGCMIRDAIKVVVKDGAGAESLWKYDVASYKKQPPRSYYQNAALHQALVYERVAQDRDVIRRVIASGYPIVFGVSVFDSFDTRETERTGAVPYPADSEAMLGGHAILMSGYDERVVWARNSWGGAWGQRGYFTLPWEYVLNPDLAEDFWVIKGVET
jgi:C1A family cysteine protease